MRILDVEDMAAADAPGLTDHLLAGETVHAAFRSPTAAVLFTERRIVHVQRENLLAEKVETSSYSYRSIGHFSMTEGTAGETRCTLRIWIGAEPQPLQLRADDGTGLRSLQKLLAEKVF